MTGPAAELYQAVILEHNRAPRNYRRLEDATGTADGHNPACGDDITVFVKVTDGVIEDVSFQGRGCAVSRASASLMTQAVKGRTVPDVEQLFHAFHELMTGADTAADLIPGLGRLAVLSRVRTFPLRVTCATLPWHALTTALRP